MKLACFLYVHKRVDLACIRKTWETGTKKEPPDFLFRFKEVKTYADNCRAESQ